MGGGGDGERSGDWKRYVPDGGGYRQPNVLERFVSRVYGMLDGPATWFRESIVEPNRKDYAWYHRQFRRVPTFDQCYIDDPVCMYEANSQYKRDRSVDTEIVSILRMRLDACGKENFPDLAPCEPLKEDLALAEENWFTKYGDLGAYHDVRKAYMKQKHRMIWERRHGKVGTGMKKDSFAEP